MSAPGPAAAGGGPGSGREADSLLNALRVVRERWPIVVLAVLATTIAAFAYSVTRPDVYEATASVLFGQPQLADQALGVQRDTIQPEREAATQVLIATSPEVARRASEEVGDEAADLDLTEQITVESAESADILTFTALAPDPRQAAAIANAYARQYVAFSRESEVQQLDASLRSLETEIQQAPAGSVERRDLEQRRSTVQSLKAAANGGAKVIGIAQPPVSRVSPTPVRDALLGFIFGLVLGLVIVFALDLFDRRTRSVGELEGLYRMQALASIPQVSFTARTQQDRALGFEPYRVLRNALGFAELTRSLDVIMITSAMPAEGKSTVSLNLARAMALSGQRVVLVECDLRRPGLARSLGIDNPIGGLTTALVGRRKVTELLQPFSPGLAHLSLLSSGPLPPNAAELLRSPRMGQLLSELKDTGARVIIDAPPLLPVADAQGLLDHPQIDGAVVVARAMQTTREECTRARAVLDQHRLEPLGIVVTGLKEEAQYGYYGVDPGGVPAAPEQPEALETERSARS